MKIKFNNQVWKVDKETFIGSNKYYVVDDGLYVPVKFCEVIHEINMKKIQTLFEHIDQYSISEMFVDYLSCSNCPLGNEIECDSCYNKVYDYLFKED